MTPHQRSLPPQFSLPIRMASAILVAIVQYCTSDGLAQHTLQVDDVLALFAALVKHCTDVVQLQ